MNFIRPKSLSLNYQRFTPSGFKERGFRKFDFDQLDDYELTPRPSWLSDQLDDYELTPRPSWLSDKLDDYELTPNLADYLTN